MNCQQFRQIMDSYIGDELLVETNHDVLRHLENCPACREELSTRRYLRTKLRSAIRNSADARINPVFARRLEANLRQTALRPTVWEKLRAGTYVNSPIFAAAIAACLLFVVLFGVNRLRQSPAPEQASIEQGQEFKPVENPQLAATNEPSFIKAAWREVTREAVGDHKNCALHFRLKEKPITLDEAAKKFGAFNKDLDKTVKTALRGKVSGAGDARKEREKIEILEAHSCVFAGRRFAHVVLRKGKKTVSVLVADTDSFEDAGGETIASEPIENLQVARFSAAHHAVFVVSDLSERENAAIAERIAPAVNRHFEQAKA
ncbi:MAG: zf-HC2 domain-containing protein [Acidobacteriota bacterium]|nr:zf-HC2 domain-containing protein [Acidobacteriota bacterium]